MTYPRNMRIYHTDYHFAIFSLDFHEYFLKKKKRTNKTKQQRRI